MLEYLVTKPTIDPFLISLQQKKKKKIWKETNPTNQFFDWKSYISYKIRSA